jgi:6-phospho-beta-glucosidase
MHYAQQGAPTPEEADAQFQATFMQVNPEEGEGYAGVALDIMTALTTGEPLYTALNVPNQGAISAMRPDDVVEVSCVVDGDGVRPLPIGDVPAGPALLMQVIKHYERLTVRAVAERSRALAVDALMAHPLVLSYSRARALVDDYLAAHAPYVGGWA